jgi:hypothetical protein
MRDEKVTRVLVEPGDDQKLTSQPFDWLRSQQGEQCAGLDN